MIGCWEPWIVGWWRLWILIWSHHADTLRKLPANPVDSGHLFLIFLIIKNELFLNGFFEVVVNHLLTALSSQTLCYLMWFQIYPLCHCYEGTLQSAFRVVRTCKGSLCPCSWKAYPVTSHDSPVIVVGRRWQFFYFKVSWTVGKGKSFKWCATDQKFFKVVSDVRRQIQPAFMFCDWIQHVRILPTIKMPLRTFVSWSSCSKGLNHIVACY
jgi:hypothetical protein